LDPAAGEHKVRPYLCTFAGKIENLTVDLGYPAGFTFKSKVRKWCLIPWHFTNDKSAKKSASGFFFSEEKG